MTMTLTIITSAHGLYCMALQHSMGLQHSNCRNEMAPSASMGTLIPETCLDATQLLVSGTVRT